MNGNPVDQDLPVLDALQPVDAVEERGLSGARGADDAEHLALVHPEANPVEDVERPEMLVQILDFNHDCHLASRRSLSRETG